MVMVKFRIPRESALVEVSSPEPKVYFMIYDLLTYKRDFGKWEKPESLYDPYKKTFPVGLIPRVKAFLNSKGYRVRVIDERELPRERLKSEWEERYKLRKYQEKAVKKAIKSKMGVIALPVGSGKTIVGLRIVYELSYPALIIVHTKELLYQWGERVREILKVEPGYIGDNKWDEREITIAMIQTLLSRGVENLKKNYGVIIFDECHRTSAAEKFYLLGVSLPQLYRFGLSATPWRRIRGEELKIEAVTGPIIAEIKADDLIREGFLARPDFEIITYPTSPDFSENYKELYEAVVINNEERNKAIVKKTEELVRKGHRVLIDVKRIEHGEILKRMLIQLGISTEFLSSQSPNRREILEAFKEGRIKVLVSTLLKEGVDIPEISAIILAGGGKSDIMTIQTIGRALRPKKGMKAVIVDVRDDNLLLYTHFIERQKALKQYYGRYYPRRLLDSLSRDG